MDDRTLRVLELDKILRMLEERATWAGGRELAAATRPVTDLAEVRRAVAETTQACDAARDAGPCPMGGIRDIRRSLDRARRGSVLEAEALLDIASTLAAIRNVKGYLTSLRAETFGLLAAQAERLAPARDIEDAIHWCISDDGQVLDRASEKLASLRQKIRRLEEKARESLETLLRSFDRARYLQEPVITLRNDRLVLPVKYEHRSSVPGIVHDQSSSGQTVFVEPMAVVEINNEIRGLVADEKEEVARILGDLTARVAGRHPALKESMEALAKVDYFFAKAALAADMDASEPLVKPPGPGATLMLRKARHPLLGRKAVPIDVRLGDPFATMVITGPNTGGKTVSLKTVGLLVLMTRCGFHIPANPESEVPAYNEVFADIGDEQSIEQNLSTFSSHMTQIVNVLSRAGEESLALLDELGAGTDPSEGAALGMAILDELRQRGVHTVATTHYGQLKAYASSRPGVQNACVEFDPETLQPTFRLLIGLPGASNALAVASRLGLEGRIVDGARRFMDSDAVRIDRLIADVQAMRQEASLDREEAARARAESERARLRYQQDLEKLRAARQDVLSRAREEATSLLRKARAEAAEVIADLRKAGTAVREIDDAARRARERLAAAARAVSQDSGATPEDRDRTPAGEEAPGPAPGAGPDLGLDSWYGHGHGPGPGPGLELEIEGAGETLERLTPDQAVPGTHVYVPDLRGTGVIVRADADSAAAEVQVGVARVTLPVAGLRLCPEPSPPREDAARSRLGPAGYGGVTTGALEVGKAHEVRPEVSVRGMTVDDALATVDKYLDDAFLAGLGTVRIIHGKGTGTLRQAVREFLRRHPHVKSFRLADRTEGGEGATVAEMRQA